ncbi:FUSC family protein [Streptomyces sp. BBFR102]|uniref:FUSC family protein n=1 Tax=Streptomyces sp. BBFR102 TaxID=3448171 RepID=UPI003F53DF01
MIRSPDGAHRPRRLPRLPPVDRGRAVRVLLAFALAFGSVTAVGGLEYGAFAAMGCYLDAYGNRDPYPRRALLTGLLALGFVLAFFAGSLAAGHTWAMVGVLSLVAMAATLYVDTLDLSGPGGYFVILVAALGVFLPPVGPAEIAVRSGLVALGAGCAWLLGAVDRFTAPHRPEQRAASTALEAVAAFARAAAEAGPGRPEGPLADARQAACSSLHRAWSALDGTRTGWRPRAPDARQKALHALLVRLEGVLDVVEDSLTEGGAPVPGPWPRWLSDTAERVRAGRLPDPWPVPEADPGGAAPYEAAAVWPEPLPPRRRLVAELRRLYAPSSPFPAVALRVGLAVAGGTTIAALVAVLHPAWVAVGAAAALQGGPSRRPTWRTRWRLAGTVVGVGLTAAVFHAYEPGVWMTVVLASAGHALYRGLPLSSLFARTMLSTPVALLIANAATLGRPGLGDLATFRLLDVALGLALGMLTTLLVRGVPVRRVRAAVQGAVAASAPALRDRLLTGSADPRSLGRAWEAVSALWTMHAAVPAEEIRSTRTAAQFFPTLLALRRLLAWSLLAPPGLPGPGEAARTGAYLDALSTAAGAGLPGSPEIRAALPSPPLPGHPELSRRLGALHRALASAPPASTGRPRHRGRLRGRVLRRR